jgi:hypothetical protein
VRITGVDKEVGTVILQQRRLARLAALAVTIALSATIAFAPVTTTRASNAIARPGASITSTLGSNGQELEFIDLRGDVYRVEVSGNNQYGQYTIADFYTPGETTVLNGYYWVGQINMDEYDVSGGYLRKQFTNVPQNQGYNRWCYNDYYDTAQGCD